MLRNTISFLILKVDQKLMIQADNTVQLLECLKRGGVGVGGEEAEMMISKGFDRSTTTP